MHELASCGIHRAEVCSLEAIACRASPSKVIQRCWTSVFLRDDMIYLMREDGIFIMQQAVFTASSCLLAHLPSQVFWDLHLLRHTSMMLAAVFGDVLQLSPYA